MSTVVRGPDGKIKIYTKGADTVILERLGKNQPYTDVTLAHLEVSGLLKISGLLSDTACRIMQQKVFERCVSHSEIFQIKNTNNGQKSMTKLRILLMVVERL